MNNTINSYKDIFPSLPGIYIFKDKHDGILYIGKAKQLCKRISSYFSKQKTDWKICELIKEHTKIDYIITQNEIEALLLEAHLIRSFKPKYNVLLKNGNPFLYLYISNEAIPKLELKRIKKEKGTYFGPFIYKQKARNVYNSLTRIFRLNFCSKTIKNGCLNYHLGRCAGNCLSNFNTEEYKMRVNLVRYLLKEDYNSYKEDIENQIYQANKELNFEKSKHLNEYLTNFESIIKMLKSGFTETKYLKDVTTIVTPFKPTIAKTTQALEHLKDLLQLKELPVTIDCFDISHFQSSYIVGSSIRYKYGLPDKQNFRRFKIKSLQEQNDYAALAEIVERRYKDRSQLPDLILIDGGKGQLSTIEKLNLNAPIISLAKREETLFSSTFEQGIKLDLQTPLGQLLISLRDYAHHFAITYHKMLRKKNLLSQ